jgi:heme A synthase
MNAVPGPAAAPAADRLAPYAWATLAYTLFVIVWGSLVRITGSGAGCGQHWPTCHGEIIPTDPVLETIIEFGHRVTSGLTVIVIGILMVWAARRFGAGSFGKRMGRLSFIFILIECVIGAALVLLEYVATNASPWRALWMAGHLGNTFLLTGFLLGVAWAAVGKRAPSWRALGTARPLVLALGLGILVVSMTGGVTALGDTLFPIDTANTTLLERIRGEQDGVTHFLMQLRIVHPVLATLVGLALIVVPLNQAGGDGVGVGEKRWAMVVAAASLTQVLFGVANILLNAPAWMQVGHLLLAFALWLVFVWYAFTVSVERASREHA